LHSESLAELSLFISEWIRFMYFHNELCWSHVFEVAVMFFFTMK
jgi:hypothetical protein